MTIEQPPPIDEPDEDLDRANDQVFRRPVSAREREYFSKPPPERKAR